MMNTQILLTSFGTMDESSYRELTSLEDRVEEETGLRCARLWLSRRCSVAMGRTHIDDVDTSHSIMLPLLVQRGDEWYRLQSYSRTVAEPLLNPSSVKTVARVLEEGLEKREGLVHVLMAHGSGGRHIAELDELSSILRDDIVLCTLKGQKPWRELSIQAENVRITPFLLTGGHHVRKEAAETIVPFLIDGGHEVTLVREGLVSSLPSLADILITGFKEKLHKLSIL